MKAIKNTISIYFSKWYLSLLVLLKSLLKAAYLFGLDFYFMN